MIITQDQFDLKWFDSIPWLSREEGNPGRRNPPIYKNIVTAFDTETTAIPEIEQSVMYIWQWQFGPNITVVGRTWEEYKFFVRKLTCLMTEEQRIVVYVHNLSYDFQFLRAAHDFKTEDVFAIKSRKVLKATADHLEFRCSYLHSNMSLAEYTAKMKVKHQKLSGKEFDYTKKRYPWTPLTERELEYCVNDVIGLVEAIITEMAIDGDNLNTIPMTSTGYVRRDAKKAMRDVSHTWLVSQLPSYPVYKRLREAFRGGNTHANRYFAGEILDNVNSADRSSSYPDVQVNCLFPVGRFVHIKDPTPDKILGYLRDYKRALLANVAFINIRLSDMLWGCPYIPKAKCVELDRGTYDNGRVIAAEALSITITDVDLRIILDEYEFDAMIVIDAYHARYGRLPEELLDVTRQYYKDKTELKGIVEQEVYYIKQKNKINAVFGMSAQDPVKQSVKFYTRDMAEYPGCDFELDWTDPEYLLEKHNKRAFLSYAWGVWVTAWARERLERGIRLVHDTPGAEFVYCDTDSVKYTGDVDWGKLNATLEDGSRANRAYATDPKGITHYMGVYEYDGKYDRFVTLGAKKYVYEENGELHITVAGVAKKEGAKELAENGGIEAFKPGFIFVRAGGTESVYNDYPPMSSYEVDGGVIDIGPNIYIRDSTYTVGITKEYETLLRTSKEIIKKVLDNFEEL